MRGRGVSLWRRSLSTARPPRPSDALLHETTAQWQSLVTPGVGETLLRDGYCVIHGAFPTSFTKHVRQEMQYLHATGQMYANSTHILLHGEQSTALLEKHHIVETELVLPEIRRQVPTLEWFFDSQQVFKAVESVVPDWLSLCGYMIKLQYNEGNGGCFPMHFDSYGDDGKCITAVLYLNEEWRDGDGGEIVLYPFPKHDLKPVIVRPLDGDLVLFSSQQMLHRVMPARKPRYCLTTWMYCTPDSRTAAGRSQQYQVGPRGGESYELEVLEKVMRSSFRRHLAKLYHQDEWDTSLRQSHRHTDEFSKYMATQEKELNIITAATAQMLAKFQAKDPSQPSNLPVDADNLLDFIQKDVKCQTLLRELPIAWF